ncbi:hypothetical protein EDD22DRAFT_771097, partial [Suillus occidentalis]
DSCPNTHWDLERNTTEWSVYIKVLVRAGNEITSLMLEALQLTRSNATSFDPYGLFIMYNNPQNYFNGNAPHNVTGCINSCVHTMSSTKVPCTIANGTVADSFLRYDGLHPSQQSDRIVAWAVTAVVIGEDNRWTTFELSLSHLQISR